MKCILFLHDTTLDTPRGAELTIKELMVFGKEKGYEIMHDALKSFDATKTHIELADLVIINSTSRCTYEKDLITYILSKQLLYIKVEYDYNFCIRRNILCTVDKAIRNCCDTEKFHLFRSLFAKAKLNVFQSPKHYQAHFEFYGEALNNYLIMPPMVDINNLKPSEIKEDQSIPFFGNLNYLKGGNDYVDYAKEHPNKTFPVYGRNTLKRELPTNITFHEPISNTDVLKILGKTKTFFCKPVWPEPSGRLVAEAFLSGCEIISNDRIGTFSFDFYPNDKESAIEEMRLAPHNFFREIDKIITEHSNTHPQSLGKVLVYKSYGGLGDIFFCLPAILKLSKVSTELHFAVAPRLVEFFTIYFKTVTIVNEEDTRKNEANYDKVYELGNYPAFRGYDLPHALIYPTHKKVKQHAIQHYIDTVSKLHISIENHLDRYPFFQQSKNPNKPYFVVHHGAGFLLKIWPTQKFAELIERLSNLFPNLGCKIIQGPEDPNITQHFSKEMQHVELITGGMTEVGKIMSGALFHIGNDAGITHVAGSFNIPTVGIYGPTGPGSWGSFAEHNELIWGKKGVCNLKCNYDVILNCDHRICLTSITVDRVIEALFKVLKKGYSNTNSILRINPLVLIDFNENDCLITLNDNEFLIEYHSDEMKSNVETLLNEPFRKLQINDQLQSVVDLFKNHNILLDVPSFQY